jgi:hypothetical protein
VPATDPPTTVAGNDYATDATVQFQLSFTADSDPFNYWYAYGYAYKGVASGLEQTNSRGYQYSNYCSDVSNCSWDAPVVSNQQVRIYAYVYVYGDGYNKRYDFWVSNPDLRYEDIAPGETLTIPLVVTHTAPAAGTGSVQGTVQLGLNIDGVDYGDRFSYPVWPYSYHYVTGYSSGVAYSNPGDYLIDNVPAGTYTFRPRSYLYDRPSEIDPWRPSYLYWPYTNGDPVNDQVTVVAGQVAQKDFSNVTGILTGRLMLTGTLHNEDLEYYLLYAYGGRYYEPGVGWINQPTYGGYAYDQVYGSDTDQSYRLFLTPGPWYPYYLQTYASDTELLEYRNYSQMRVYDYNYYYDGRSYDFGLPSEVLSGTATFEPDREYCTGSVIIRFRVAGDEGQLRSPYVSGYAYLYDGDGRLELQSNVTGWSYPPTMVTAPEVEVHGIPGDYDLSYVRAYTDDGTQVRFPSIPVELECGVRKGRDLTGPEIVIAHPPAGLNTNEASVAVVGTATDDTGIGNIDVNGNAVVFAPTENPEAPNEVAFSYDLDVTSGVKTVTTTAVDLAGNESFDSRDIYVDLWLPTVAISSPTADDVSGPQADVLIAVEGADQGYGFSLSVSLDGEVIYEASGPPNEDAPSSLAFSETRSLAAGTYTITAEVSDVADNVASDAVTIRVNDPPVLSVDLATQSVQYSDQLSTVTVTAQDSDSESLTLTTTWAQDGGPVEEGLPGELSATAGGCAGNGQGGVACTWTLDGQVLIGTGTYQITFGVDDGVDPREVGTELIVTAEGASAVFGDDNPISVQVATPGGVSGQFALIASVSESQPDEPADLAGAGDIAKAELSMSLVPVGPGSSLAGDCGLSTAGSGYDGVQTITCDFSGVPVNTYTVEVKIGGDYYDGLGEDVLTVYDPSLGFTTGGGWFHWPNTQDKTNFGYTMKYGKNGSNVKGSLLLIRHQTHGQKYRIKSNALSGLALGEDAGVYGWASFSGKATYLQPGWEEAEGNHGFTAYVEDRDEPGSGNDRFWIEARDKDGSVILVMSLDGPAPGNATAIQGGNIVVPH